MADNEKKAMSSKANETASEESKAAEKVAKAAKGSSKKTDKPNVFSRMAKGTKRFFKDFKGEWKKVTWPSGKTVLNHSLVVIVVVLVFGLIIFGFDTGLSSIIDGLVSLAHNHDAHDVAETTTNTAQMLSLFFIK